LQGVLKGTASGEVILEKVMTDEQVTPGDRIITSGGDQIFPKGVTVGTVMKVSPGADLFLNIRVKPSANLNQLEEVLIITKKEDRAPSVAETNSVRAVDLLTQRLPSVPDKPAVDPATGTAASGTTAKSAAANPQSDTGAGNAQKPVAAARKPATHPVNQPPTQPASRTPASSETGGSQPGTSEDQPH
jgi:rod shape-determining protein MreC